MDDVVRILEDIINDFDVNKFKNFFYKKTNDFISQDKPLDGCNDELFDESTQIGTFKVNDVHEFIVIAAKVNKELTQKSGKKAQYTFAKKILKQMIQYTGGFFIFYDSNGNFRFSFIYSIPRPDGKQDWSNFRRYTYYVSKDQTNRTFLQQMQAASFESLEKIIDAFSVEKVTKEFYRNIVELYYTLINNYNNKGLQRFPKEDQNEKEEFAIRLLGRLLFCWFLKMKKDGSKDSLIPQKYLSSELVKNFNGDYYHEYVEPLFFQILNKPLKERLEKYKTKSYSLIPFLNGGLFEPHDSDYYPVTAINEMGISPNINILTISNDWFANLFEVFERYNFTIDENTLVDTEVSIDPEMLGKIFENLLAEYNPETKENARKATGSYYTPREIVDYMVDESLKNYLCEKTKLSRDIIEELLKHENFEAAANLNEHDKEAIIDAIDKIKVIDPACGSGAFPMGILHKLQVILENVDPQSKIWFKKKIGQIVDPLLQKELQIKLEEENWDYIHKLGLIQHSIYGVDIQPIAVEISKLRFFLSLIVDEKIDDEKQNRGIIPLPNLEFKFVAANTLIGLEIFPTIMNLRSNNDGIDINLDKLIEELRKLRKEYFNSIENKLELQKKFVELQKQIFERSLNWQKDIGQQIQLSMWEPFKFYSSNWFDPEWMFGVTDGFDIVIGNPPYGIKMDNIDNLIKTYKHFDRQKNSASFFIELGSLLSNSKGIIAYIIPKSLSFSEGWKKTRELVTHKNRLISVIDVSKAFEDVKLEQIIICFSKKTIIGKYQFNVGERWSGEIKVSDKISKSMIDQLDILPIYINKRKQSILSKLQQGSILLSEISKTFRGLPFQSKLSNSGQPILRGKNIGKYKIYGSIDKISLPQEILDSAKVIEILKPKIISQNIVTHVMNPYDRIMVIATIDTEGFLTLDTVMNTYLTTDRFTLQYVLAILNSQLASWFYCWFVYNKAIMTMHFDKYYMGKLPIKDVDLKTQQCLINLIDQILTAKKQNPSADTTRWEREIDTLVYKLYDLTDEEIQVVEGNVT